MRKENIIQQLESHVIEFKAWLELNYSSESIEEGRYDDTGYPKWNEIEDAFELAFKEVQFEDLDEGELKSIGFLLARQWDVGIIFPYFKEEISGIGMTENQLLILSEYGLNSKEWSFKQQCAASLHKVKNNKERAKRVALQYFKDADNDIRRHALNSLYKLGYENLNDLLDISWGFNIEYEMVMCFEIWQKTNMERFLARLKEVENDDREFIKNAVLEFRKTTIKKN